MPITETSCVGITFIQSFQAYGDRKASLTPPPVQRLGVVIDQGVWEDDPIKPCYHGYSQAGGVTCS